jgi:hypothetical protein
MRQNTGERGEELNGVRGEGKEMRGERRRVKKEQRRVEQTTEKSGERGDRICGAAGELHGATCEKA